ncbi:hypothetical protein PAHAL_6G199700 [Panicum hallii]|uniref:Uncharacterized protein n=1 Tax=Panicum hallii TaxID=206008 RepID=A0A2T8IH33_9POAL|nr:hypothetical protein PAHAL_6G199700 [Panicum hallii]
MADANAAVPAMPPPPPPRPGWRSIAAAVVRSRRAVAAVVYLVLGMVWCLFASLGLRRLARAACGEGCALVAGADEVSRFATGSLVVLAIVPGLDVLAPADRKVLGVFLLGMFGFLSSFFLALVGFMLKAYSPAKGSRLERSGSVIIDVVVSSLLALNCFVVLPSLALFVWGRMLVLWQHI